LLCGRRLLRRNTALVSSYGVGVKLRPQAYRPAIECMLLTPAGSQGKVAALHSLGCGILHSKSVSLASARVTARGKSGPAMLHSLMLLATKIVEVLFFVGIVGCVLVVSISWISIFKEGFSKSDEHNQPVR